ncbi:phosphoribosyltransferase [Thiofilum flexile]|uniref:phosphoribosyltransferase n=1 Tax=Thiofilum flexile TaxID=125627 RepID=UPI00036AA98E|nr:phosphoribosyltransferase [Thiofilum flexile]
MPTIREYPIPSVASKPFALFRSDHLLKQHPTYKAAKAGDEQAAFVLIKELALEFLYSLRLHIPVNAIFVAPFAREASGDNAIPQVLATFCQSIFKGEADQDIVQITRVFHTGADPMERLAMRPEFEGMVIANRPYVLVDDVTSMGGTLAELANYIQGQGGTITAIIVLVNAGRLDNFTADKKIIKLLEQRYSNDITQIFHIRPAALTANEAQYLIGFKTADEIRNRLAKAKKEIYLRLRSKGIGITEDDE